MKLYYYFLVIISYSDKIREINDDLLKENLYEVYNGKYMTPPLISLPIAIPADEA